MTEQFIKLLEVFGIRKKLRKLSDTVTDVVVDGGVISDDSELAAIDQSVFPAVVVDAFVYDTAKDSDGGAWRERCSHTSWENETLSGNWLGSAANEAAARAISGATTGSYYYDTTALGFYTLNAGSGKTATYRGNVRQFPAKVLITVEVGRVVLWDLTQAGCPMWMVFTRGGDLQIYSGAITAAAALNGTMVVGENTTGALSVISFASDYGYFRLTTTSRYSAGKVSLRNTSNPLIESGVLAVIVSREVNDVAMTVLPNAPVDVATGLPVPTIAVATAGGVSVITDSGSVWDLTDTSNTYCTQVRFTNDGRIAYTMDGSGLARKWRIDAIPSADFAVGAGGLNVKGNSAEFYGIDGVTAADINLIGAATVYTAGDTKEAELATGSSAGLSVLHRNPASPADGMVAYVTKDYNSGWLPGDIKGAWLADTVAETVTGAELVTNGTFTTDTTGWTAGNGATLASVGGMLEVTNAGATYGGAYQILSGLTIGKTYVVSGDFTKGTAVDGSIRLGDGAYGSFNRGYQALSASGSFLINFVATATTATLSAFNANGSGATNKYDNISCRLADVDRSVKAKGLQAFGSLTKAAVASGAQLMGYSGFTAANYAEQPYNSDLDFGTGDWCFMFWVREAANSASEILFCRGAGTGAGAWSGAHIYAYVNSSGNIVGNVSDDGSTADTITSSAVVDDSTPRFVCLLRRSANIELWINGAKAASDVALSAAIASLNNASATLRVSGWQYDNTLPLTNGTLALLRATATAPSAEQIKHIYETEKALFQANAACTLAGSSNAVTALAYDDETDLLHVGTSYGRSTFHGLELVDSEATAVGAITALSAVGGVIAQGGATAVDVYVPAQNLREELARGDEHAANGIEFFYFTATAAQTAFALGVGWEPVATYSQGAILTKASGAGNWSASFDGFKWSAVLGTGATVSDKIAVMARRT